MEEVAWNHTPREANYLADSFAKAGLEFPRGHRVFESLPNFARANFLLDMADT
ncbi:hypothetical protein SESBI_11668 [Sesbania bispinosa]|nr:hypothetical protein SESBI_11668 [Sesbania bispinosa]